jgi:glycosyltransferase involved in cell wall biosynthesis
VRRGQVDDRVAVVGHAPDERPYLERAAAMVLPLRVGGGSRLKALVAWASGVPIVSTRLGLEGLPARAGQNALLAESVAEWVDALTAVMRDHALRERLAGAGREEVERHYDWARIAPSLRAAYATLPHVR